MLALLDTKPCGPVPYPHIPFTFHINDHLQKWAILGSFCVHHGSGCIRISIFRSDQKDTTRKEYLALAEGTNTRRRSTLLAGQILTRRNTLSPLRSGPWLFIDLLTLMSFFHSIALTALSAALGAGRCRDAGSVRSPG